MRVCTRSEMGSTSAVRPLSRDGCGRTGGRSGRRWNGPPERPGRGRGSRAEQGAEVVGGVPGCTGHGDRIAPAPLVHAPGGAGPVVGADPGEPRDTVHHRSARRVEGDLPGLGRVAQARLEHDRGRARAAAFVSRGVARRRYRRGRTRRAGLALRPAPRPGRRPPAGGSGSATRSRRIAGGSGSPLVSRAFADIPPAWPPRAGAADMTAAS